MKNYKEKEFESNGEKLKRRRDLRVNSKSNMVSSNRNDEYFDEFIEDYNYALLLDDDAIHYDFSKEINIENIW